MIGAYFALMAASSLETDLNNVQSYLRRLTDAQRDTVIKLPLSPFAKRLINPHHREPGMPERQGDSSLYKDVTLEQMCRSIRKNQYAGSLGSGAIAVGFITCPAALLCLAWNPPASAVWIAGIAVVGVLLFLRSLSTVVVPVQDRWQRLLEGGKLT